MTDKQTKKRQTRPPSSAGSRPPFPKFSGYVEAEAHYIFRPSTIWVRPLFTELGPKPPSQKRCFCHEANEYMRRHNQSITDSYSADSDRPFRTDRCGSGQEFASLTGLSRPYWHYRTFPTPVTSDELKGRTSSPAVKNTRGRQYHPRCVPTSRICSFYSVYIYISDSSRDTGNRSVCQWIHDGYTTQQCQMSMSVSLSNVNLYSAFS